MMLSTGTIILIIAVVVILFIIMMYNRLISLKNHVENAFADIDVQMKLRFDLVDNLVNTVKGYATHEKETIENVTKARTSFMSASSTEDKLQANNMLTGALKSLFAVAENYPDLKANQNFLELQSELSDIENKIAAARRFYNSSIKEFNTVTQTFPSNLIASTFGFSTKEYFEISDENEKKVPKVQF